jgi:hypothetical protein
VWLIYQLSANIWRGVMLSAQYNVSVIWPAVNVNGVMAINGGVISNLWRHGGIVA